MIWPYGKEEKFGIEIDEDYCKRAFAAKGINWDAWQNWDLRDDWKRFLKTDPDHDWKLAWINQKIYNKTHEVVTHRMDIGGIIMEWNSCIEIKPKE